MKIKKEKVKKDKPEAVQEEKVDTNMKNSIKSINSVVFDSLKKLTNKSDDERVKASLQLLQHLAKHSGADEKAKNEIDYVLKRLIRGIGASTTESRTGFFTTLVGFLQTQNTITIETTLQMIKNQLHVASITDKEDADALVGQILVCGAILRANRIPDASNDEIRGVFEILLETSKYKSYHNALAFTFIIELIEQVNVEQFKETIWSPLQTELYKPWLKQNMHTVHCLIKLQTKFPKITNKFLKTKFGDSDILNQQNYQALLKIFWENNTNIEVVAQPSFECFAKYLANCKNLMDFWTNDLEKFLEKNNSKLYEIKTIKILTDILSNCDPNKILISSLITTNFVKMMANSLKLLKTKSEDILMLFYNEFFETLLVCCEKLDENDENNADEKVEIIKKLILYPGMLNIEKYTTNRVIHQLIGSLKEKGVQELFKIYKDIFLNEIVKNPTNSTDKWLNVERQNAGFMLQTLIAQKSVQMSIDWRTEQLKFFMTLGLFNTNNKLEIIKQKDNDSELWLAKDFCDQMFNIFYTNLQTKLPRLQEQETILNNLMKFCNEIIHRKNFSKYFRIKVDEKIFKVWQKISDVIVKKSAKHKSGNDKLQLVFHILVLHMGFQLFREPDMAETAIMDLEKCMMKTKRKKVNGENNESEELEWIEVVVDLFLHLLSQNTSGFRNIVNSVFPHLCGNLTLTAVNQILSVLDMKDGYNPLDEHNDDMENEMGNNSDFNHNKLNGEQEDSNAESENSEEDSENEDVYDEGDDDDDDDDDIMGEEEENESITETNKLRNAISIALTNIGNNDDDQDSIDLDDLTEEDGKKLDEALSAAFRAMRKSSEESKRSKGYRIKTTTTMHFRIRVLDLIEIYIQHNPDLVILLEILINLFNMIEYCAEKEMEILANKVEKILMKLTVLRHFSNTNDVNEENICDYMRLIIEKKIRSSSFEAHNKVRSKCCHFLIHVAKNLNKTDELTKISTMFNEYLNDFIKSRNPTVNITLLTEIFKMRWQGIWNLSMELLQNGLNESTRTYRRIQIIEILENLYKNHELIRQNINLSRKSFELIEKCIQKHLKLLNSSNKLSIREFTIILNLLTSINRCYNKLKLEFFISKDELFEIVQEIRRKIKLDTTQNYSKFCKTFGLTIIKNSDVVVVVNAQMDDEITVQIGNDRKKVKEKLNINVKVNGVHDNDVDNATVKKKRKMNSENDVRKEKKLKKEERLKIASKGFNNNECSFSTVQPDAELSDGPEIDDSG